MGGSRRGRQRYRKRLKVPRDLTSAAGCARLLATSVLPTSPRVCQVVWPIARQIVSRNPDLIIAISSFFVLDVKAATSTIPIVGIFAAPIELGIVPNLARPGGNITGISVDVGGDQWLKRVQLLKEALPQISRLGILAARSAWEHWSAAIRENDALKNLVSIVGPPYEQPTDEQEYPRVFLALAQEGAEGLLGRTMLKTLPIED